MNELHFPWLTLAILTSLVGAIWARRFGDSDHGRAIWLISSSLTLILTLGAWRDFSSLEVAAAADPLAAWLGPPAQALMIDHLSAPLLPLVGLLFLLTAVGTMQSKVRRYSFAWKMFSEAILLATFSSRDPWMVIGLLALGVLPPLLELRQRQKPLRVYAAHMGLFVALLVVGQLMVDSGGRAQAAAGPGWWAAAALLGAVLVRSGIAPLHCWVTDLFENATLGTALLFVTPLSGAYAAARLVLPVAPDDMLRGMGVMSLVATVYAAGMALIQSDARRLFSYLFLSHSALVLVGLEMGTALGLTGALCVWLSISVALSGFGLTLRALEARRGRLSLHEFGGLYEHCPNLAMCFVLTGLASVGFPGTFGFVGMELLIDGAVDAYPHVGMAVVVAAALNGIAIVQTYFRLFTGARYHSTISLWLRARERYAVLTLALIILLGGFFPQMVVTGRHRAAEELLAHHGEATSAHPSEPLAK